MKKMFRFATDRSGSTAIIFSLALLPAMALLGAAIDYGRLLTERSKIQSAADSAALSAGVDVTGASDSSLQTVADSMVRAQLAHSQVAVRSVSLRTVGSELVLRVDGRTDTMFGGLLGRKTADLSATAAVPKRVGLKQDLYFLLDRSASMGLAATPEGRDKLTRLAGCAFACHEKEGGQTISNLQTAIDNGIQTRVDVLRDAVGGMIDKMIARKTPRDTFRVAIDTFDETPHQSVALTSDLVGAKGFLTHYQLGRDTSFSSAMPQFSAEVGTQGDGVVAPRKFAILVSDGVQGRRDRAGGFHPFDKSLCDTVKGQNVTLIVLNTKYLPMPGDRSYLDTVQPIHDQLEPALKACASPGWYFSAMDRADIMAAFSAIDSAMTAALRLSR